MGYAFFDKSGNFNPLDYGLSVGDVINVICVGGGGGGASGYVSTSYGKNGGTGGTTSFGSHCTALGGSGGVANTTQATQGQYLGGHGHSGGYAAGGGAGGYIPGAPDWGGNGQDGMYASVNAAIAVGVPGGTAGVGGAYNASSGGSLLSGSLTRFLSGWSPNGAARWDGNPGGFFGAGSGYHYQTYSAAGGGGTGYGAGGGAGSYNNTVSQATTFGGNSGQVRRASIVLATTSSIAVTVGGGGSGAGYSSAGNNGSGGSAGASPGTGGGAGGYGGVPGSSGSASLDAYNDYFCAGGGGAGGCVEVFW